MFKVLPKNIKSGLKTSLSQPYFKFSLVKVEFVHLNNALTCTFRPGSGKYKIRKQQSENTSLSTIC